MLKIKQKRRLRAFILFRYAEPFGGFYAVLGFISYLMVR